MITMIKNIKLTNRIFVAFGIIMILSLFPYCKSQDSVTTLSQQEQLDAYRQDIVFDQAISCKDPLAYVPDTNSFVKEIRINVHFLNSEDSIHGLDEEKGKWTMKFLVHNANKRLRNNHKMNLPAGNTTPNINPKYQYVLTPVANDEGYFWHYDDELCYFINKGKARNNYSRNVINKYEIGEDSIINIFVMPHHKDSVKKASYKPLGTGIALGGSLKMAGIVENHEKPWLFATLLNHELGHIFNLRHSWNSNDGCDDTPKNPNCWGKSDKEGCEGPVSNNLMDYNASQMAISPCQIGTVHKSFTRLNSKNRKYIIPRWCERDDSKLLTIFEDTHWYGERDVDADIHIQDGVSLTIHCRLSIPHGGEIVIHPGGELRINEGARLHNSCGDLWSGIRILKAGKKEGQLIISQQATIENI